MECTCSCKLNETGNPDVVKDATLILMAILEEIQPNLGIEDECIWVGNPGKVYTVQSLYKELLKEVIIDVMDVQLI